MQRPWTAVLVTALLTLFSSVRAAASTGAASNESLLWGPYKPNLYFGVRPRLPESVFGGLLWAAVDDYQKAQTSFRYTCEQNENMAGYGWDAYDAREGGIQNIHDVGNQLDITTSFVKVPGGTHGGSWGLRVSGKLREDASPDHPSTVVFFLGQEGLGGALKNTDEFDEKGYEGAVHFEGQTAELGKFNVEVTTGPSSNEHPLVTHPSASDRPLDRTQVNVFNAPAQALWQGKTAYFSQLQQTLRVVADQYGEENLPPPPLLYMISSTEQQEGNMHFIQKTFRGSWEFDVLFSSGSASESMTSKLLTKHLEENQKSFAEAYKKRLPASPPFDKPQYDPFSKSLFSNLLGGLGYFHGDQVIDRSYAAEYEEENEGFWEEAAEARGRNMQQRQGPYSLFTSVPSRPFFPRGFLWDEGFHLLPIVQWDLGVVLEVITSWFRTMDEDGWIPREQILGAEARTKVPAEFQVQYPHYANPPTLFLTLEHVLNRMTSNKNPVSTADKAAHRVALAELYPFLKQNYNWYRKTQRGDIKGYDREAFSTREGYRWRGRTPTHILTSGLDDYPRAQPPHPGELHTDLISWMGLMTRSIKRIAEYLGEDDDAKNFAKTEEAIKKNVDDLHWDASQKTYCDCSVDEYEESMHACHKGYISIFPFLTGLLDPEHPHLGAILDLIKDPAELWSPHGIRSLSQKDPFYGTEENYWRSPVWVNINYLVLENLLKIATKKGPQQEKARKMFVDLRKNIVDTVYESWKETRFAWEQYNPDDGKGQRTQHFTGWTSLVVNVLGMPDLSKGVGEHGEL